jgi:hypothetical protein
MFRLLKTLYHGSRARDVMVLSSRIRKLRERERANHVLWYKIPLIAASTPRVLYGHPPLCSIVSSSQLLIAALGSTFSLSVMQCQHPSQAPHWWRLCRSEVDGSCALSKLA